MEVPCQSNDIHRDRLSVHDLFLTGFSLDLFETVGVRAPDVFDLFTLSAELQSMKLGIAVLFFITAALYASVGLGGGSSYTALLAITDTPYFIIPIIALICNVCVVAGNSLRYMRAGLIDFKSAYPLFLLSIPAAWIGGQLPISERLFVALLCVALFIAGTKLLFSSTEVGVMETKDRKRPFITMIIGGGIGFYSGLIGIGGGIFLAPVLYSLRWGRAQQIAAVCSVFILVNSISGLVGQFSKTNNVNHYTDIVIYWPLVLAVIVGAAIGNKVSLKLLSEQHLRRITGALILFVAIRLLMRWVSMIGYA